MNAQKFIAAVAVFVAAGSAVAADAAATTGAAAAATTTVAVSSLNLPSINITHSSARSRAEVHAEAVEFVKNHKTTFAILLEQYKN